MSSPRNPHRTRCQCSRQPALHAAREFGASEAAARGLLPFEITAKDCLCTTRHSERPDLAERVRRERQLICSRARQRRADTNHLSPPCTRFRRPRDAASRTRAIGLLPAAAPLVIDNRYSVEFRRGPHSWTGTAAGRRNAREAGCPTTRSTGRQPSATPATCYEA